MLCSLSLSLSLSLWGFCTSIPLLKDARALRDKPQLGRITYEKQTVLLTHTHACTKTASGATEFRNTDTVKDNYSRWRDLVLFRAFSCSNINNYNLIPYNTLLLP